MPPDVSSQHHLGSCLAKYIKPKSNESSRSTTNLLEIQGIEDRDKWQHRVTISRSPDCEIL